MSGENTDLYEADAFVSNQNQQRTLGASMHGMDQTRLQNRGLPKWTQLKLASEKKKIGDDPMTTTLEEGLQVQDTFGFAASDEMGMQTGDLSRQGNEKKRRPKQGRRQELPARLPSWKQQAPPELNPSSEGSMNLPSENMPWQGTPRNTRRGKPLEVRKAHTARQALEGRQWQPRLGNRERRDNLATPPRPSPAPAPLRDDLLEDAGHEDTVYLNPRLAAREQNVRLAKGLLQDSIQALQEDERREQEVAKRTALEQDMSFAEDCQKMLIGISDGIPSRVAEMPTNRSFRAAEVPSVTAAASAALAKASNAYERPMPGGSSQAAESAQAKRDWDAYVQAKPHLPEWAAWWEPQAPVPKKEHPSDLVMKSVQTRGNATAGGCFGFRASSKGAEARRQSRLMPDRIKL